MLIRLIVHQGSEDFVLTRIAQGEVMLTVLDRKRHVYLHPHFRSAERLDKLLHLYQYVAPWDMTDEMRNNVMDALPEELNDFLRFAFNLK